jgi:NhaA family Na+:H+ antiporter
MHSNAPRPSRAQIISESLLSSTQRLFRITTLSGVALGLAAIAALVWANTGSGNSYSSFWHTPISIGIGNFSVTRDLHFVVNEILMTMFFLAVGMEIRHEIHGGSLSNIKKTLLPVIAAIGGIIAPAAVYLAFAHQPQQQMGWAIPTATDIAFALGVLALLGSRIPTQARIFLLTLAVADDIFAIAIIAIFYSGDINNVGLLIAGMGIALTLFMQHLGISHALAYLIPGSVLWLGLYIAGLHPTLAGVILGFMTPVTAKPSIEPPIENLRRNLLSISVKHWNNVPADTLEEVAAIAKTHRELLPPVVRVQLAITYWVNFLVMPLFALANAGILLSGFEITQETLAISSGIFFALIVGKPIGILTAILLTTRLKIAEKDVSLTWPLLTVLSILGGIGFTMSIFIANLAFADHEAFLTAAKLAILIASGLAIALGLGIGAAFLKKAKIPPQ